MRLDATRGAKTRRSALIAATLALALVAWGSGGDRSFAGSTGASAPRCSLAHKTPDPNVCADPKNPRAREIVQIARDVQKESGLPAVVFGVWQRGKELATGALGRALPGKSATRNVHFRVGNVTEAFMSTLLLQLVQDGKIKLSDPVSKWYPDLPLSRRVTIDMLAHNTSGYPDFVTNEAFVNRFHADPFQLWRADELFGLAFGQAQVFPPNTSWAFSDTNYFVLGKILEKVAGKPAGRQIKERILDKLGLEDTDAPLTSAIREPVLHAYSSERNLYEEATYWSPTWLVPYGNMTSNLFDMRRWVEALAAGKLLSRASHKTQVAPSNVGKGPFATKAFYYTMGFLVDSGWISTNPQLVGYNGVIAHLPAKKLTVVVFTNLGRKSDDAVSYSIEIYLRVAKLLAPGNPPHLQPKPRGG